MTLRTRRTNTWFYCAVKDYFYSGIQMNSTNNKVWTTEGGNDKQRLEANKKRAPGEKQRLMERQRKRSRQPVRQRKKKGKQWVWKRRERGEGESMCHRWLPRPDWLQLPAKQPVWFVCVCVCKCVFISPNPLTVTAWGVHDLPNHWLEQACSLPSLCLLHANTKT